MQTQSKRLIIPILLALLCLLPIATLFHSDALDRWQLNRILMAEPDEPSYVLMTKSLATGNGFSVASITGKETFYPPGLSLQLAAWSKIFGGGGGSLKSLHICVALTLSLAILLSYFLAKRLFELWNQPHADRHAIVITALFATSWHTLDNALFIFSEPLFMAAVFAWLLAAMKLDRWWMRPRAASIVALLACAAHLVRSAGVVCLAATLLYIVIGLLRHRKKAAPADTKSRWLALITAGVLIGAVTLITQFAAASAPNSYSQQFLSRLGANTFRAMWHHLGDFSSALVPFPFWEGGHPQEIFFAWLGPLLLIPCIAGVICKITRGSNAPTRFVEIFFLLYTILFLLWPFSFTRFWIPLLPLAFAYAAFFLRHARPKFKLALVLLALILNIQQLALFFPLRQARLTAVSDSLAQAAAIIRKNSPDPARTIICCDNEDFFTLSWYLNPNFNEPACKITAPNPRGRNEPIILEQFDRAQKTNSKLFIVSYFKHATYEAEPTMLLVLQNLQHDHPEKFNAATIKKIHQDSNTTCVWEITPSNTP